MNIILQSHLMRSIKLKFNVYCLIGSLYDLWNPNYIMKNKETASYFVRVTHGTYANPML